MKNEEEKQCKQYFLNFAIFQGGNWSLPNFPKISRNKLQNLKGGSTDIRQVTNKIQWQGGTCFFKETLDTKPNKVNKRTILSKYKFSLQLREDMWHFLTPY